MEKREEEETRWARLVERRRWRADDARWAVATWAASGETIAAFAARHGLHRERLRRWRSRLDGPRGARRQRPDRPQTAARPVALVPVSVRTSTPLAMDDDSRVVVAAGGVRIGIRDLSSTSPDWVARLIGRLAAEVAP